MPITEAPPSTLSSRSLPARKSSLLSSTPPAFLPLIAIFSVLLYISLDIIGRVAFGHDFGSGESADAKEIASAWHNHVNMGLTYSGFIAPLLVRTFPWIVKLPIPTLQAQGTTKMIVDRLTKKIIERGVVNEKGRDILSLLMMANRDAKEGNRLSDEQLVANVNTFMCVAFFPAFAFVICDHDDADFDVYLDGVCVACGVLCGVDYSMVGHETTAGSVALTTYALARNPEIQQKLRDELISAGDITYESIQKLEYLDAIVKEGYVPSYIISLHHAPGLMMYC